MVLIGCPAMNLPFISVIIPTYNRADLLREALASIASQEFRDFETIVVDDGSKDDTGKVAQGCGFPVRFHRQENQGPGAARNAGIGLARGQYVAFLDSDDTWFPWTLELFYRAIASGPGTAFISGIDAPMEESGQRHAYGLDQMTLRRYPNMLAACTGRMPPVGGTPSICVERGALVHAGGFVNKAITGEDADLWLRLGACPGFVRIESPPVFRLRTHVGRVTRQLEPSVAGAWYLLQQERNHAYPGGRGYSRRRRRIICGMVRSVSRECLNHGSVREAFRLYRASFWWNFQLGNWKYLAGLPVKALMGRAS
jgi:glycosyltransferase involved in cell wall biosynthesis